jgi:hypothetical protein
LAEPLIDLSDFDVWLSEWRDIRRAGGAGSGRFARAPHGPLDGLACADFAIIDYTTGPWPLAPSEVDLRVSVLQQYQASPNGLFDPAARKSTSAMRIYQPDDCAPPDPDEDMDTVYASSYFLAALELLGSRPLQPLRALESARTPAGIEELLESLDWSRPDVELARAAGVALCLATIGDVGPEWFKRYFAWLEKHVDTKTGFWRKGVAAAAIDRMKGAFYQYTVFDRYWAALPRPDKALKTTLSLINGDGFFSEHGPGWTDVAAVYVIDRSFRQCGKTFARTRELLSTLAVAVNKKIQNESFRETVAPHKMAALVSLCALLAQVLPGSVRSERPLRFYGDRRLFV